MAVDGQSRIKEIAGKLELPEWWVQSVIIEYFPCREYLKGEEAWFFNFNLIDEKMVNEIPSKKVIIGKGSD